MAAALPVFVHVPKTGGGTIKVAFEGHLQSQSHKPAIEVAALQRPADERPWSFAFVRDPWDRMVSWYYWRHQAESRPEGF